MKTIVIVSLLCCWSCTKTTEMPQPRQFEHDEVEFNNTAMASYILGIYERADNPPKLEQAEVSALQQGHMAHLGRMFNEGYSLATGPFQVPAEEHQRGLVIFPGKLGEEKVKALMSEDPMVKAGRLKVKTLKWWTERDNMKFFSHPPVQE